MIQLQASGHWVQRRPRPRPKEYGPWEFDLCHGRFNVPPVDDISNKNQKKGVENGFEEIYNRPLEQCNKPQVPQNTNMKGFHS